MEREIGQVKKPKFSIYMPGSFNFKANRYKLCSRQISYDHINYNRKQFEEEKLRWLWRAVRGAVTLCAGPSGSARDLGQDTFLGKVPLSTTCCMNGYRCVDGATWQNAVGGGWAYILWWTIIRFRMGGRRIQWNTIFIIILQWGFFVEKLLVMKILLVASGPLGSNSR